MAFLGPNDILVLEIDQGTVQRIVNGNMLPHPIGEDQSKKQIVSFGTENELELDARNL